MYLLSKLNKNASTTATIYLNWEVNKALVGDRRLSRQEGFQYFSSIGHARYSNILKWLLAFHYRCPYLVLFSLYPSLFWGLRSKRNLRKLQFFLLKVSESCKVFGYRTWPIKSTHPIQYLDSCNVFLSNSNCWIDVPFIDKIR